MRCFSLTRCKSNQGEGWGTAEEGTWCQLPLAWTRTKHSYLWLLLFSDMLFLFRHMLYRSVQRCTRHVFAAVWNRPFNLSTQQAPGIAVTFTMPRVCSCVAAWNLLACVHLSFVMTQCCDLESFCSCHVRDLNIALEGETFTLNLPGWRQTLHQGRVGGSDNYNIEAATCAA